MLPPRPLVFFTLFVLALGAASAAAELRVELEPPDLEEIARADALRASIGRVAHFAVTRSLDIDPLAQTHGVWDRRTGETVLWRLEVRSPGARTLSLAFDTFELPPGARLEIGVPGGARLRPLVRADRTDNGTLWTPTLAGDTLQLALRVPIEHLDVLDLHLTAVQHGYAGFGGDDPPFGTCQPDVACRELEPTWQEVGRSVGLLTVDGVRFCSGFLLNNTAVDERPLFLTAKHCGVRPDNADSVVVRWNVHPRTCGGAASPERRIGSFSLGARVLASDTATDFVLLELDHPVDRRHGVRFAGWSRSALPPQRTVSVHHPQATAQKIAVDYDAPRPTRHLERRARRHADHWMVRAWEVGSTEGGSSGAPLFDERGLAVGWLHGGHAACGNREPDWFGRLAAAWDGPTPETRLRDWLDPAETYAVSLQPLEP
ncbi:MAG: serine protease [Acidobacteriota bacterium]